MTKLSLRKLAAVHRFGPPPARPGKNHAAMAGLYAENPYFCLCKLIFTNLIALCHVYATRFYSWLQPSV